MESFDELLTVREVMQVLKRSRAGLYLILSRGEIEAVKHGKMTCFRRSEIERYLTSLPKALVAQANRTREAGHVAA